MEALVKFEHVAFGYEADTEVLHGINLEIKRGDVIAVLGPNGAGKTTFVKHAIGLLKPKSGRVLVNGRDTKEASVAQIASTLGYVFQSPSHMLFAPTVREELAFGPSNLKHPKDQIEQEVKEALKIVNLADKEQDPPLALSFGQQKRVSIAAILAMRSPHPGHGRADCRTGLSELHELHGFHPANARFRSDPVHHPRCGPGGHLCQPCLIDRGWPTSLRMELRRMCCATSTDSKPAALCPHRCLR